jgi:site-specific DNA-methyltransferase (adenine-specific)
MSHPRFNLLQGDCLEILPTIASGSFDLCVTSPPYNIGLKYNEFRDDASRKDYLEWCGRWAAEIRRVLADDGSFFLNIGSAPANPLMPHQLILALCGGESPMFVLQNTFHWIKSISVETREGALISAGHFKPINSKRFVNDCHEFVFHLTRSGTVELDRKAAGVPYVHKSNIARWGHTGGRDLRCRGNNWFIPYDTIKHRAKDRPHPATFPVALVGQCVKIHGRGEQSRLLDPFLGIGSSAVAARQCGLQEFTGIEIDAQYHQYALERLSGAAAPTENDFFLR